MPIIHALADVVELVDTPDLGSGAARCGGSSPLIRTNIKLPFAVSRRSLTSTLSSI